MDISKCHLLELQTSHPQHLSIIAPHLPPLHNYGDARSLQAMPSHLHGRELPFLQSRRSYRRRSQSKIMPAGSQREADMLTTLLQVNLADDGENRAMIDEPGQGTVNPEDGTCLARSNFILHRLTTPDAEADHAQKQLAGAKGAIKKSSITSSYTPIEWVPADDSEESTSPSTSTDQLDWALDAPQGFQMYLDLVQGDTSNLPQLPHNLFDDHPELRPYASLLLAHYAANSRQSFEENDTTPSTKLTIPCWARALGTASLSGSRALKNNAAAKKALWST